MSFTLQEDFAPTDTDFDSFGLAGEQYWSFSWVAGSTYTLTQFSVKLTKTGAPTGTLTAYIYNDDGGVHHPNTLLATSTNTINVTTLTGSSIYYDFQFTGQAITSGTRYHAVLSCLGGSVDGSNKPEYHYHSTGGAEVANFSSDHATWTVDETAIQNILKTWITSGGAETPIAGLGKRLHTIIHFQG